MKTKITLIADGGKILTDGVHYGRVVYLAPEKSAEDWHEIPEEEYEAIMASKYAETQGGERNA
jgi:hypothetical protein